MITLTILLAGLFAHAGFQGTQTTTSLGIFTGVKCSQGLTCTRSGGNLNMVAAGGIQARVAATATTITSSQCGSTFYNSGAVVIKLPKLATSNLGCRLTFIVANASNFDINPDDADTILNSTNVTGDASRNATLGGSIVLEGVSTTQWAVVAINGTWTDIN